MSIKFPDKGFAQSKLYAPDPPVAVAINAPSLPPLQLTLVPIKVADNGVGGFTITEIEWYNLNLNLLLRHHMYQLINY